MKEKFEMRAFREDFTPIDFDSKFTLSNETELTSDNLGYFQSLVDSIDYRLSNWSQRPTMEDVKNRFSTISNSILFFHQDFKDPIGWAWFSPYFTYDWINSVHELPTPNSIYLGGTYIKKELDIPYTSGIQLYSYTFDFLLSRYEYVYGYMDSWNKAPIKICHRIGAKEFNFIDYSK